MCRRRPPVGHTGVEEPDVQRSETVLNRPGEFPLRGQVNRVDPQHGNLRAEFDAGLLDVRRGDAS
jgi:hypothetical protein